jgi:hypothetical protein
MAKAVKKAESGVVTPRLRKGQFKRLGRLAAKNPDRAERVSDRMIERDTRIQRGKNYVADKLAKQKAAAAEPKKQGGKVAKKK